MEQEKEDAKLLIRKNGTWTVDAVTSGTYGRIYDAQLTEAITKHVDLGVWKVPAASYATQDPKRATTLYASDRDCFIALVDDSHPIEVPGANGKDTLFRGIIFRNSEVGAATLEMFTYLYRYICDNRLIWGLQDAQELKIRHTSGGPMRFLYEAKPAIRRYLTSGTQDTVAAIQSAKIKEVAESDKGTLAWLKARGFTQSEAKKTLDLASEDTGNPRSVWGLLQGATALAQECPFGDERLELERKAGKLMSAVA